MDKISPQHLNQILGIYPPFHIKDVSLSKQDNAIKITLSNSEDRKGFFSRNKGDSPKLEWQHVRIGRFDTIIGIEASISTHSKIQSKVPPSFLGSENKKYTNQVEQLIIFGLKKGIDASSLSTLSGTDISIIKDIEREYFHSSSSLSSLPPSAAKIWKDIITGNFQIKTNSTALNMLITSLSLLSTNNEDASVQQESCEKLHSYFVKNKSQLNSEYSQLGIIDSTQMHSDDEPNKKKIVLTKDHIIWGQLLSGKMQVKSNHTEFNLQIAGMIQRYITASPKDKIELVKRFMSFLKKNMSKLKQEMDIIRKTAIEMDELSSSFSNIPASDNPVWDEIVNGEILIKSSFIPFNLVISKLKNFRTMRSSYEAREFVVNNSSVLVDEIQQINDYIESKRIGAVKNA